MDRRKLLLAFAAAASAALTRPAGAAFVDPLDAAALASPLAAQGLINGLALAGARIVAVGARGHVLLSDDAGHNWRQAPVPVSVDLTAVSFADERNGWAVGHGGAILASRDGGESWTRLLDGRELGQRLLAAGGDGIAPADAQRFADEGPDKPFLDVCFVSAREGWVVGAFGLILHTDDAGASWRPWLARSDNPKGLHLYAIRAIGDALYAAGEQGLLLRLDRGARRFRALAGGYAGTLFGLVGDEHAVIAYGLRGHAVRSGDGGAHWQPVALPGAATLSAATRVDGSGLLLAGQNGQLYLSRDGGQRFDLLPLAQRVPTSAVLALADGALLLAGPRGVIRADRPL